MELLSLAPASILNLGGGALSVGAAADLVLFNPQASWVVRAAEFTSNSRVTPFEGLPVQGRVMASWVGGIPTFSRD
jgi:dihydroorotase